MTHNITIAVVSGLIVGIPALTIIIAMLVFNRHELKKIELQGELKTTDRRGY